jgi:hypothetical protein
MLALVFLVVTQAEIEVPATVAPLSRLLPELGRRASMKLVAGASVREDVVGIASPKRPIRQLMDGIAEAVNATWTETRGEWVLSRTKKQEAENQAIDAAYRTKRLEAALAEIKIDQPFEEAHALALAAMRKEVLTKDPTRINAAEMKSLGDRAPANRFGRRLIERIGVPTLASLPYNATTVFSTNPTRRQRKLALSSLNEMYRAFAEEQNRYARAIAQLEGSPPPRTNGGFDLITPAPTTPSSILVLVTPQLAGTMRIQLIFADRDGGHLLNQYVSLPVPRSANPYEPDRGTPNVIFEPETALVSRNRAEWTSAVWDRVQQPEKFEPLAPFWRESLAAWSALRDRPVIAQWSDELLGLWPAPISEVPLALMQSGLARSHAIEVSASRVVIRPHQPALSHAIRVNRPAVGRFTRLTRQNEVTSMAALIEVLAQTDQHQEMAVENYLNRLFSPQLIWDNTGMARLIALAGPTQRAALERTGKLAYGDMNPAQRNWLQHMVFDRRSFNQMGEWTAGVTDRFQNSLQSEPTQAYPNDLPPNLTLNLSVEVGEGALVNRTGEMWAALTLDEIAAQRLPLGIPIPESLRYRPGKLRRYTASLRLNSVQGWDFTATDVSGLSAKGVPYDELSEEFRKQVQDRMAEVRRRAGIPPQ